MILYNGHMQNIPWKKIESLEEEIKQLKSPSKKTKQKKDPLKGIWKGLRFSNTEIEEAKKIWFNEGHLLELKHKK